MFSVLFFNHKRPVVLQCNGIYLPFRLPHKQRNIPKILQELIHVSKWLWSVTLLFLEDIYIKKVYDFKAVNTSNMGTVCERCSYNVHMPRLSGKLLYNLSGYFL